MFCPIVEILTLFRHRSPDLRKHPYDHCFELLKKYILISVHQVVFLMFILFFHLEHIPLFLHFPDSLCEFLCLR